MTRRRSWTWAGLLGSLLALAATVGRAPAPARGGRTLAPAERTQAPVAPPSASTDRTPVPSAKHGPAGGVGLPARRPVLAAAAAATRPAASPAVRPGRHGFVALPRFPTGPPIA